MEAELNLSQTYGAHITGMVPDICSPSWSENSLVFICEFRPAPAPEGVPWETVQVILPAQCTVQQLRLRLCLQAPELCRPPDPLALLDPARFLLLYSQDADWYEVYDDCQVLRTLGMPWSRDAAGRQTARIVVTPPPLAATEEKLSQRRSLVYLIGHDLDAAAAERLGEISYTRRKLASPRRQELRRRDDVAYATEPWTSPVPVTTELQDHVTRKLPVRLHYSEVSFTVTVEPALTPAGLTAVFRRVMEDLALGCEEGGLVLQVCGREEFLSGDAPLHDFLWVRECLRTSQEIHLQVVPEAQLAQEAVGPEDWPLVDGFTGQSSSHQDLRLEGRSVDHILMISLWDCPRRFRVKLLGFDIPHPPSRHPQSVQVEVTLLYGNKELASVVSSPKPFHDEVLWNEWLELDVLMRDLPRGAKLGLTLLAGPPNGPPPRDSSSPTSGGRAANRGRGKVLYFVNLLLIDHRSVLSQGPHTLHMWPYPEQEEEPFTHQADKLSCATNPDVADAMAISFLLDRYSFPVILPHSTGSPESRPPHPGPHAPADPRPSPNTDLSTSSPDSPSSYSLSPSSPFPDQYPSPSSSILTHPGILSPHPHTSTPRPSSVADPAPLPTAPRPSLAPDPAPLPTASPVTAHKSSLRRFREESIHYSSSLPHYLRSVNWLQPAMVQDVHWLLGHWEAGELGLATALELLSVDFPDQRVRRLAVQRLDSLTNQELLRYLLQLVQTLKVEPYHDSFLARFLLQRALRSKRIGHFFFWYLRSEVSGCAYFRQRMALVLEAYLLGCGASTLTSLAGQVQAVEALQGVASTIRTLYPDDLPPTAAATLQELLRNCDLPSEFLVPFDPRVRAGRILLDRCKVKASKKKPLWLEFSPMPSPGPTAPPVGIIFKQGDDLRQDMLVLQTLVVMDSIWQMKSLDLNLVPYGCISTGHNMGMIEIVREAVTIAAVQRTQGGTTGAFKNNALFDWLKEKCPLQEIHYQAMERFVTSCAGYCVATYVLGIGDRHNDNIMITDQGNLFHIDFGHILGNRKRFLGVNRERVPFVLTPDFLYVMGRVKGRSSLYFQRFRELCTQAYLSLRSHSGLLVTLFSLMLLTGIPELSAAEDMRYLREALQEDRPEDQARAHFLQQISACEQLGWTVQANWWIHMVGGIK